MGSSEKGSLGDRLRQLRGSRSQASFAREIGVSQQNYNRYENGDVAPKSQFLHKIATQFDVDMGWLLSGNPEKSPTRLDAQTMRQDETEHKAGLNHLDIMALKQQPKKVAELEARIAALEQAVVRLTGKGE